MAIKPWYESFLINLLLKVNKFFVKDLRENNKERDSGSAHPIKCDLPKPF